ncbi:carbohydrate porin [Novacetimonas hansenii]|uniref:Carbohydrate porin n=1 Tax=Novacetimonas hansenii TaxID=436 RepID=A0AAW5ERC7_NOVHA|nr:carbohydrate porin [Novacetimonas hansenii]MCJ8353306.1 carbohydrate porin [Novacetimonas hansenii]
MIAFFAMRKNTCCHGWSFVKTTLIFGALVTISSVQALAQTFQDNSNSDARLRVATPLMANPSSKPVVPPFSRPEALFTNPFGMTSWLRSRGVALTMDNTNEYTDALSAPTAGHPNYRQGSSNAGQVNTALHINWDKILGLKGFATHTLFTSRYGTTANRMMGDWLAHSSEIYGGGGNVVVHLVTAYGEENLLGGRVSIAGGRLTEMSEFSASSLFCNFQNNSFCGRPKAAIDNQYITSYPAGEWGFRVRGRPSRYTYIQAGVYFAERGIYANSQHRTGFHFNSSNIVGQLAPIELGWEPVLGSKHELPGHYKIGGQLISAPNPDNYYDVNGQPYALSGRTARNHQQTWSTWLEVDQKILHHPYSNSEGGLTVMGGVIYNDPRTSLRNYETYVAFVDRGFIRSRPYDAFGMVMTYVKIAPGVSDTDILDLSMIPARTAPNHATGVQGHATIFETNYQIHVMRGVVLAPDFQIYFHPNAQRNLKNVEFIGFKSQIQIM